MLRLGSRMCHYRCAGNAMMNTVMMTTTGRRSIPQRLVLLRQRSLTTTTPTSTRSITMMRKTTTVTRTTSIFSRPSLLYHLNQHHHRSLVSNTATTIFPTSTTTTSTSTTTTTSTTTATRKPSSHQRGRMWHQNGGQPIPFHIKDLQPSSSSSSSSFSPPHSYYHRGYYGVSSSVSSSSTTTTITTPPSSSLSSLYFNDTATHSKSHTDLYQPNDNNDDTTGTPDTEEDPPLIVVLDLDECLIHSHFLHSSMDAALYAHQLQQQQRPRTTNQPTKHTTSPTFDSFRIVLQEQTPQFNYLQHDNMHHGSPNHFMNGTTHVHVFLRPGCLEFLDQVTRLYPTYIYTAAQSIYANPILNHLSQSVLRRQQPPPPQQQQPVNHHTTTPTNSNSKNCIFRGRFYREHCIYDRRTNQYYKDLTQLHRHNMHCTIPARTHKMVLIDNNPISLLKNPNNGILVDSFYGPFQPPPLDDASTLPDGLDSDRTFSNLLHYLQELSSVKDVRPIIQRDKQVWYSTGHSWSRRRTSPVRRNLDTNTTSTTVTTPTIVALPILHNQKNIPATTNTTTTTSTATTDTTQPTPTNLFYKYVSP